MTLRIRPNLVSATELSRILGCARSVISDYVIAGAPQEQNAGGNPRYDTVAFILWLRTYRPLGSTTDSARRLKTAQAELKEHEVAALRGETISVSDVVAIVETQLVAARARLYAIPSRLAMDVSVCSDPVTIERMIGAEIDGALREITGTTDEP